MRGNRAKMLLSLTTMTRLKRLTGWDVEVQGGIAGAHAALGLLGSACWYLLEQQL